MTRRLSTGTEISRWQNLLEVLVSGIRDQIHQVSHQPPGHYPPFVGTLFLFIAMANLLNVVPGYMAPTGSVSTTTALAICVFVARPMYGLRAEGPATYLKHHVRPTWLMLPFNVIGEISRTIALAVRLYGNIMSGTITPTLFLGLAMTESTAIYGFVVAMILIFANPFWDYVSAATGS